MAISERKRLTYTAIAVMLVGLVTGFILGNSLLASPTGLVEQYNERTTTTESTTSLVHSHDGDVHTHITTITTEIVETTPHYTFHQQTAIVQKPGTTNDAPVTQGPGSNEVLLLGRAYLPATITVTAGTTVTWTNQDGVEHTVTSDDGLFDAILLGSDTFSYTFTDSGTFSYSCMPHPDMIGRVIVE